MKGRRVKTLRPVCGLQRTEGAREGWRVGNAGAWTAPKLQEGREINLGLGGPGILWSQGAGQEDSVGLPEDGLKLKKAHWDLGLSAPSEYWAEMGSGVWMQ